MTADTDADAAYMYLYEIKAVVVSGFPLSAVKLLLAHQPSLKHHHMLALCNFQSEDHRVKVFIYLRLCHFASYDDEIQE